LVHLHHDLDPPYLFSPLFLPLLYFRVLGRDRVRVRKRVRDRVRNRDRDRIRTLMGL
jgi:hypothetical protein